jgi:hypothetical protein
MNDPTTPIVTRTAAGDAPLAASCEAVEKALMDHILGTLEGDNRTEVGDHVVLCASCNRLLIATRHMLAAIAGEGEDLQKGA